METFLDKLAAQIVTHFGDDLSNVTVVLPNKRARIFLIEALKNQITTTVFAPKIVSIEDFVQEMAGIRTIDPIDLLFEFYKVYEQLTPVSKMQSFELFANWGKILLQDFNELDRYLLDPDHVFSYLKDIEVLKRWDLTPQQTTKMIDDSLEFWSRLPEYYNTFYQHLKNLGVGYQGLIYREAVLHLADFVQSIPEKHQYVFAGFNALNQSEEHIFQKMMKEEKAFVYWDIDTVFLNDYYHDAGLFVRKFKKNWKQYAHQDFEWVVDHFAQYKNIQIIGTPKTIGQAKIAGGIIEELSNDNHPLERVALVLGEENLLIPILYALPEGVSSLNITMGYNSKNNPAQILIHKLFKMHTNAVKRSESSYTFYYKEVLDILSHPLVEPYVAASDLVQRINTYNITFLSNKKLFELHPEANVLFQYLFKPWGTETLPILNRLTHILLIIKNSLNDSSEQEKIAKTFVYSIYKTLVKIISYQENHGLINSVSMLFALYKQIVDLAEVSFEGEPLMGLQIMGVLESRVLDFDTVIITSMNEGKFPAGKTSNSFIPYDVKKELGLPTFKEKDAIYSYHFYHLLLRAKNIYLLYNSDGEGLDKGEKSRFITQLEIEKQPKHELSHKIYNAFLPDKAYEPMVVEKSPRVLSRLKEIATGRGFSPSGLTNYLRNPIAFYKQRVLGISDVDEVEENIALNTLGTIIHGVLEELYMPYIGVFLSESALLGMLKLVEAEVANQFKLIYKEGEIYKGKNLLAFEVAKRNVTNFLKLELEAVRAGDAIKVLHLEHHLECVLDDPRLPYPVKIAGNVDRIEMRNDKLRITDYKTGKVDKNTVLLKDWSQLTASIKSDKIIQLLCYVCMYETQLNGVGVEAGILSFKNMKSGFLPYGFKYGPKDIDYDITPEVLQAFKHELVGLILEILNPELPFAEKMEEI